MAFVSCIFYNTIINILLLIAGTNNPSNSATLAESFLEGVRRHPNVHVDTVKLKDLSIDHFSIDHYNPEVQHEADFLHVQECMQAANGLVIATPVWNFGVPAHLKNLLDRIGSFALDDTHSKGTLGGLPFYMIFTGGAPAPAWPGMMEKTSSFIAEGLQYFGASHMGNHFEPRCTVGKGQFGLVVDSRPESLEAVAKKGEEFARVVDQFAKTGKAPIAKRAKSGLMKIGERILKKFG